MKIIKSLLKTEIEITASELQDFMVMLPPEMTGGLFDWIKRKFDLSLWPSKKKKESL